MQGEIEHFSAMILDALQRALDEDVGSGDITTNSIIPPDARTMGNILAKQVGIIAGLDVADAIFKMLDPEAELIAHCTEGSRVERHQTVATVSGQARALLAGERSALNFIGRMSGIATLTRQFVDAVAGTKAIILDTRKTAPGLRALDRLAVLRGGGGNHRMGLFDMVLIKDNHIDLAGSLTEAVRRAREAGPNLELEVEARTLDEVKEAVELRVARILLDNMPPEEMRRAVALNAGRTKLEASGNIILDNVREVAESGVDYISIGALTHSVRALDVSMLIHKSGL